MVYFFGPGKKAQQKVIEEKNKELSSYDSRIITAQNNLDVRKQQVKDIGEQLEQKTQEVSDKFEKLLEKSENYTTFIEQVQRKAKALDVLVQNSNYDTPTNSSDHKYYEFKFSATVSGQYNKIKRFLWEVENAMGRLVKIGNIDIVPPITDKQGNISLNLTLSTFFLP